MKRAESYDLAKSKKTESLAEYLFTHNVRHGVVILKKVAHVARKKIPVFDHTYCERLTVTTSLDYKKRELVKQFVVIESCRPLHTLSSTCCAAWMPS